MAQFKEYVKNDFLSYNISNNLGCVGKSDVDWDDLINQTCFTKQGGTKLEINGNSYSVTAVNIRSLAEHFTDNTPYRFSYNVTDISNQLVITNAKITLVAGSSADANVFLGYSGDIGKTLDLPYTFTNKVVPATSTGTPLFKFDDAYEIKVNGNGVVTDIRAAGTSGNMYYATTNGSLSDTTNNTPYTKIDDLVLHLNKKQIGPNQQSDTGNKCFYKFAVDPKSGNLTVSDLILDISLTADSGNITIGSDIIPYTYTGSDLKDLGNGFSAKKINDKLHVYCSGMKYVYIDNKYEKLPYTRPTSIGTTLSTADACKNNKQNKALCANKTSADKIIGDTTSHSGANQRYADAQGFSDTSMLNIFNLGIGIVGAAVFISKTYK
jgi:hypothetical protein